MLYFLPLSLYMLFLFPEQHKIPFPFDIFFLWQGYLSFRTGQLFF